MMVSKQNSLLIQIRQLTKSFAEAKQRLIVLDKIQLDIHAGEFVALLGASGSGKSTLLNIISGIELADQGQILVQDEDILKFSEEQFTLFRRQEIGFIFQFFNLLPTLSAIENVMLPVELAGNPYREAQQKAQKLLDAVGLGERADTLPDRLSGGEQQRIAIARALVHEPSLVLADEPTGNLDEDTGQRVMELLDQLIRSQGKTLIMATHSREIAQRADRVFQLRDAGLEPIDLAQNE
jgi:putative ABC transport system ATP-binding protein